MAAHASTYQLAAIKHSEFGVWRDVSAEVLIKNLKIPRPGQLEPDVDETS